MKFFIFDTIIHFEHMAVKRQNTLHDDVWIRLLATQETCIPSVLKH